ESSRSERSSFSSWKKASWPFARSASSTSSRSSLTRRSRLRVRAWGRFCRPRRRSSRTGVTLSLGSYRTAILSLPGTSALLELAALEVVHGQGGREHGDLDELLRLASGCDLQVQLPRPPRHLLDELFRQGAADPGPVRDLVDQRLRVRGEERRRGREALARRARLEDVFQLRVGHQVGDAGRLVG